MGKLKKLSSRDFVEAVNPRDAVAGGEHAAGLADLDLPAILADLALDHLADFRWANIHDVRLPPTARRCRRAGAPADSVGCERCRRTRCPAPLQERRQADPDRS